MKVLPVDLDDGTVAVPVPKASAAKSRLRWLLGLHRISSSEKIAGAANDQIEPSSVCLGKMVQNFLEGSSERPTKCGRSRCNCFNGHGDESSDSDIEEGDSHAEAFGIITSLVLCSSAEERALMEDAVKIVEKNRSKGGRSGENMRRVVVEGLIGIGYTASICQSRREKSPSIPAGKYEYIDVMVEEERVLLDVDFRSEFEIARPTKTYREIVQSLPPVFVGKAERLRQIVVVASEAAKKSLKKKGLHVPPWRKFEYMMAKWFSSYERTQLSTAIGSGAAAVVMAEAPVPPQLHGKMVTGSGFFI